MLRDGHTEQRLARRANALLLLDDSWSCEKVAKALYLDDDTVRGWRKTYVADGLEGLGRFEGGGSASYLSAEQESRLKAWIGGTLPRSTKAVGAYRAGVRRRLREPLGADRHAASAWARIREAGSDRTQARPGKAEGVHPSLENLLNSLDPDEGVLFLDAIHPTHAARPVGCWAPAKDHLAIEQTSGRQRLNVHGAIDLETGKTAMIDVETVDAASTMSLLETIEQMYPLLAVIHVFLDNARYHHAQAVERWLAQPGRRIRLHFFPASARI